MAHWEYKVLSGGKMGLGSMALLEQFLNELGQQQWEVINWQTDAENPLKFTGLARRPILRDLSPQEMPAAQDKAAIAAAKEEEEKEREAWIETLAREREVYAGVVAAEGPDEEDEDRDLGGDLFETLRPLVKRNKRGPGSSGSVPFLAKRLDQSEADLIGALAEAGLELADESGDSDAHEHGDEMYWLNRNSHGEIWINSMPKSRYRAPQPRETAPEPKALEPRKAAEPSENRESGRPPELLPEGDALIEKIRPMMRRNRGNRGLSGSLVFLSRALRHTEEGLTDALATLGLKLPDDPKAEPVTVEITGNDYWLNKNEKGQVWINARQPREGAGAPEATTEIGVGIPGSETAKSTHAAAEPGAEVPGVNGANVLQLALPHLAKTGRGTTVTAVVAEVAGGIGVSQALLLDALVVAGLEVPVDAGGKPVIVEHEGEQFWFSRGAEDELSLNAKPKPVRRSRARKSDW